MIRYLSKEKQWGKLLDYILEHRPPTGLDSEFSGVDFKAGQSCPGRAKIHVWSLAVPSGEYNPRGYNEATGVTLPSFAINFFRPYLEDESIVKYAHNSPVDVHAFWNSGVDVVGIVNTLGLARWVFPTRLSQSLDSLATDHLGHGKIISYKDLTSEPGLVEVERQVKYCSCGTDGCRKRKSTATQGHEKLFRTETEVIEKGTVHIPLETIVPGHRRWNLLVEYAGQDAVMALEEADYLIREAKKRDVNVPWLR